MEEQHPAVTAERSTNERAQKHTLIIVKGFDTKPPVCEDAHFSACVDVTDAGR